MACVRRLVKMLLDENERPPNRPFLLSESDIRSRFYSWDGVFSKARANSSSFYSSTLVVAFSPLLWRYSSSCASPCFFLQVSPRLFLEPRHCRHHRRLRPFWKQNATEREWKNRLNSTNTLEITQLSMPNAQTAAKALLDTRAALCSAACVCL